MNSFPRIVRSILIVAATVVVPASAAAQGTAEQRAACTGDAFQFCGAEIPNPTRVEACLRKNMKKISPACRDQFRPASARARSRTTPVATTRTDRHQIY